jgi:hypothetical protein
MSPQPSLAEIQRSFRRAILGDDDAAASFIVGDAIPAAARLDVYRNNVLASLISVLKDSFPAICKLVDARFFDFAATAFVRAHPPRQPCLAEYGREFPDFLTSFPPCRALVYLADVARLEWLVQRVAAAADRPALQPPALGGVAARDAPRLLLRLQPTHAYLASRWPIDKIWRANRPGGDTDMRIDLDSGGVLVELRRPDNEVELRLLDAGTFAFRAAFAERAPLAAAAEAALAVDSSFDTAGALARLFADGAIAAFELADGAS